MKKREIKNGKKTEVILSEATDGVNRVRLIGSARAEEEECPWEEIDAYSGRFIVAGLSYDGTSGTDGTNNNHPWIAYSTDGGETWTKSVTTAEETQPHGLLQALTYGGGRFVVAGYSYDTGGTDNYHPWIAYSTDGGETWTKSVTTAEESQPHGYLYALTYGGGRFVVAGCSYDTGGTDNYHPWIAYSTDGGETWTRSKTTAEETQPHGLLQALTYAPDSYCWKFGTENEEIEE